MNKLQLTKVLIFIRIFNFVISVLKLTKLLPKTQQNLVLLTKLQDQLLQWEQMIKKGW